VKDKNKTKTQLIEELLTLRQQFDDLKTEYHQVKQQLQLLEATMEQTRDVTGPPQLEKETDRRIVQLQMLLQEIHHRVKNNLQIISSLLFLQSEQVQDPRDRAMFTDSQNRIRSMALIHEKLYQTDDLTKIDFAEYANSLGAYLFQAYAINPALVSLRVNIENVFLDIDRAIPLGLIITELTSNALKHAFPAGLAQVGEILIDLQVQNEHQFTLIVSDNGIGLPEKIEVQTTETLGLQLVKILTRQLGGVIEVNRDGGTVFKITFTI
jgi:two-component sensor histidine kinase